MSKDAPGFSGGDDVPASARIGIVAARFNNQIVEGLLRGCLKRLEQMNIARDRIDVHRVPGAFELPVAAKMLIDSGHVSAVICLGCVIRGDTPHFDFVAGEAARGIQQVSIDEALPVIFGVLTTETHEQAVARLDTGARAAEAALEMIALQARVKT